MEATNACGYEENLFTNKPPEYLRCGACSLVLKEPVVLIDCGHKYCSTCFDTLKTSAEETNEQLRCCVDRKLVVVERVFPDLAIQRDVSCLQVNIIVQIWANNCQI